MDTPTYRPPAVPPAALTLIRRRLIAAREVADLSPEQLAAKARLSRAAVRKIEGGINTPTLGTLYALAGALGVEVADLLGPEKESGKKSAK